MKNIMYKLYVIGTETLEAKNVYIIVGITVIGSAMKMLTEINSDDHAMNNLIRIIKSLTWNLLRS